MSIYAREFRKTLGFTPYPGTLNLKIENEEHVEGYTRCISRAEPIVINPPRIPGTRLGKVYVYPAELKGLDVYVVRPAITIYKMDVIEVISEERLRDVLGLEDGDKVFVSVCCRWPRSS